MMMDIKLTMRIELELGEQAVSLTREEAHRLYVLLDDLFAAKFKPINISAAAPATWPKLGGNTAIFKNDT